MKLSVSFTLNGDPVTVETSITQTLLKLLRDDLRVTSLKNSCNVGECGACTIILDGKAVRSCLILAPTVEGKTVETIESLGTPDALHPLQKAFIEHGAIQCGYCTCGMLLTAKAFLDENPIPTREEIVTAISGNICRCTGYAKIIEAIEAAAKEMRRA